MRSVFQEQEDRASALLFCSLIMYVISSTIKNVRFVCYIVYTHTQLDNLAPRASIVMMTRFARVPNNPVLDALSCMTRADLLILHFGWL